MLGFKFEFNNAIIQEPYPCNPTDFAKKCKMYLKQAEEELDSEIFIENQCSCSLDGDTGFCGSMVGTDAFSTHLQDYRAVLANNKCHTMDRFNLKSYMDKCGNTTPE